MNTLKFLIAFLTPIFAKKIVHLKPEHDYKHLNEYVNLGEHHYLFVEDDFDFSSLNDEHIYEITEDEPVDIIEPHIDLDAHFFNQMICGNDYNWGLDRINQRNLPLDCEINNENDNGDITVYVLDTGIDTSHPWLQNSEWGTNCVGLNGCGVGDGNNADEQGHGTHVAGIIGGLNVGVSKNIKIISVKVLGDNGSGSTTGIIRGLLWVLQDVNNRKTKGIINMSLGGGKSTHLDNVINSLYDQGIITVVAAGNDDKDACNVSPARADKAVTVGASTSADTEASFSNHGSCVDIFAPGHNIYSTYPVAKGSTETLSGTSMAAPFVAGVIAHIWSNNIHLEASEIIDILYDDSTMNTLDSLDGNTINRFLYLTDQTRTPWRFILIITAIVLTILSLCSICCYCCLCYKCRCCRRREEQSPIIRERQEIIDDIIVINEILPSAPYQDVFYDEEGV